MRTELHQNNNVKPRTETVNRPDFAEIRYDELATNINFYYNQIYTFMTAPAIVRYDELATLRRRSISPELGNNRYQTQLKLATDLLRLGRRNEGFSILKELEQRLLEWQNLPQSLCYLLWVSLVRAAIGDHQGAFFLALQITSKAVAPRADTNVVNFFQAQHSPKTVIFP